LAGLVQPRAVTTAEGKGLKVLQYLHYSISGEKRVEKAMGETDEHLRLLVDSLKDYAIFTMDAKGRVLTWNSGAQRLKGYRAKEIIGKRFSVFYPPEEIRQGQPRKLLEEAAARGRCEYEGWFVRKNGSRFWAKSVITALRDESGDLRGFGNVTRDMTREKVAGEELRKANAALDSKVKERTAQLEHVNAELQAEVLERRRAEEKLESSLQALRALSAHVLAIREDERKRMSREVHDELGQSLTAIKMDLTWVAKRLTGVEEPIRKRTDAAIRLVDETVQSVRRIAAELRPAVLDDLGLSAAIEWQTQDFQARTGITCHLRMPADDILLDSERATATFRIFQELLNNVARHANATQLHVGLKQSANAVVLEVRDNGKGISDEQISNPKSLGLLGMRERIIRLGGHFAVLGEERKGTTVVVQIPTGKSPNGRGA
jgi:PAS domain S-box-containing protein